MNKLILLGNLTRDVQTKNLPSGSTVSEFGVACNRRYRTAAGEQKEETVFLDCQAFGKTGDVIAEHFHKGKQILLDGRLCQDFWEDRQTGAKRSKHFLKVDSFSFVGSKREGDDADPLADPPPAAAAPDRPPARSHRGPLDDRRAAAERPRGGGGAYPRAAGAAAAPAEAPFGDEQQFREDDIPFMWEGRRGSPL